LGFTQGREIAVESLFFAEPELAGISADETLIEDAAGKLIEAFLFNCPKHARTDLGDAGNVIERELFLLARLTEFVSELAHNCSAGNIIGQGKGARHIQEGRV
jgi:hypothetical protein